MAQGSGIRPWKRGTEARRAVSTLVVPNGDLVVTDEGFVYAGDGVTQLRNLPRQIDKAAADATYAPTAVSAQVATVASDLASVTAKAARPTGISRWDFFQTVRTVRKLVGVAWGTSSYEGTGASSPSQRIPSRLEKLLQAQINPAGVPGGYTVPIAIDTSQFTGSVQGSTSAAGFSAQSRNLANTAATTHSAAACTGFDLYYEAASGSSISVSIDGGAAEAVTTTAQGVWSSPTLTRSAHTITITGTAGTAVLNTLYVRDGDETLGVRLFINAQSGQAASAFISSTTVSSRLASLKPDFHIIQLGANDYTLQVPIATYKANLRSIVSKIVTAQGASAAPWIAFVSGLEKRVAPLAISMQAYRDATEQVAAEYPEFATYHDISGAFPKYGTPDPLVLVGADDTHPTTIGHRLSADLIFRSINRAQNLRVASTVTTTQPVAPTVTSAQPTSGVVGTAYSHTFTATGDQPMTWSVTAGSIPAGLALNASTGILSGTPTAVATSAFTVTATNAAGSGSQSVTGLSVVAAPTVPGAPTNLVLTPGNTQLTSSWTAPATDGGAAITDYIVQTSADNVTFTTFTDGVSTNAGAVITGLANGSLRYVRVAAVNAVGQGAWSTVVSATPAASADTTAPTVPGTPTATGGNAAASVAFSGSTDAVGVAGYRVYANGSATPVATGTTSPVAITGLTNGTPYTFTVSAYDGAGNESAKSAASNSVTPVIPGNTAITDGFSGGDVASLTGRTTETGGKTWVGSGVVPIGIVGGAAAVTTASGSSDLGVQQFDSGRSDGVVRFKLAAIGATPALTSGGAVLRYVDDANYLLLGVRSSSSNRYWAITKRLSGGNTTVFATTVNHAVGDVVEAQLSGSTITLVINGVAQTPQTVTDFVTSTKHGIRLGGDSAARFDDFSVSAT